MDREDLKNVTFDSDKAKWSVQVGAQDVSKRVEKKLKRAANWDEMKKKYEEVREDD